MLDSRWASIDAFAENNRDNILRDITRLVAVPSVEGTPEPGAPFGKGPKAALDKALEIAAELGLDTHNAEGYIGWAQTGPIADGQKYLKEELGLDEELIEKLVCKNIPGVWEPTDNWDNDICNDRLWS